MDKKERDNRIFNFLHMRIKDNNAQIWVETAVYTLIGLTIIAIVLSIAVPQIDRIKEKSILEQTIGALNELDVQINKVEQNAGTIKIVFFKFTKGKLEIDPAQDKLVYTLENTGLEFSEPGVSFKEGDITFLTEEFGKNFNIILELNYSHLNFSFNNGNEIKTINGAPSPYKIQIENLGKTDVEDKTNIDFKLV